MCSVMTSCLNRNETDFLSLFGGWTTVVEVSDVVETVTSQTETWLKFRDEIEAL